MANKQAPYKDSLTMGELSGWWEFETRTKTYVTLQEMFVDYTEYTMFNENYDLILNIHDFERCIFKEGIRKLGDAQSAPYMRAESWRPSDTLVSRLKPSEMTWA